MNTQTTKPKKEINGIDIYGLHDVIKSFRNQPELAKSRFQITNQWLGGDSNRSTVGTFYAGGQQHEHKKTFVFDCGEPEALLGKDQGANPVEFVLHALAGCVTTSTAMHAAARGIHIRKIETSIEGDIDLQGLLGLSDQVPTGYQNIRVSMKIDSDAEGEKLEELKELYNFSPVVGTLRNPVNVQVRIN